MLELKDVTVRRDAFTLQASLTLPANAKIAIIGASGSGKSTLLELIGGFLKPDAGQTLWNRQDISALPPAKRPVSFLFQDQNLFPHLTISQNVGLGLRPDLKLSSAQLTQIRETLGEVGLQGMENRRPASLSGGQQSRVALARILLRAKPVLLLDEPFSALGPALKEQMLDLLDRIASELGATVLMVTHDPNDARDFAPQTVVVDSGTVSPPAPTDALLDDPPPHLQAYLGSGPKR